jgi:hypothetical protein
MSVALLRYLAIILSLGSFAGCNKRSTEPHPGAEPSDTSIDSGSHNFPTNPTSADLFIATPETRRSKFEYGLRHANRHCSAVLEAVFKGGFEGTDFWRVKCADSGLWLVTFRGDMIEVDPCSSARECDRKAQGT